MLERYKLVSLNIPVKLEGNSPGVLNGGTMRFPNRRLKVKALPANLPDFLTVDISTLKIGDKVYVKDLQNDAYSILHPDGMVVVQVRTARAAIVDDVEDEEGEEGAEGEAAEAADGATPEAAAPQE